jgi:hypothetical protein
MDLLRRTLARRTAVWTAVLASLPVMAWIPLRAQPPLQSLEEYQLKAAFLYNFAKFVDWPLPAGDGKEPLVIVVLGRDPFGPVLKNTLWGKTIHNRPLVVRRVSRIEEVMPCHVLFIGNLERRRLRQALAAVEGAAVLTVSEVEDFLEQGGAVQFVPDGNKVRFEINLGAARRSGLNISSKLLSLARAVKH